MLCLLQAMSWFIDFIYESQFTGNKYINTFKSGMSL